MGGFIFKGGGGVPHEGGINFNGGGGGLKKIVGWAPPMPPMKENPAIWNWWSWPKFGLTIEVRNNFVTFGSKNKWNILIDIIYLYSG